ncbi:hypothetical protein CFIMG_006904RA [Ceratocystis fimbriata CBS 114723]|uniref:Uncharacterized protein n=1 Tax=Ceratocystis fimbriata CBS 114723 TaxID=1035309 RepID=A0A2C5WR41_9PEZI|nr:hypothetical protein CFIMG_006904RA [Ceratocystis fimbriata CBS 114723]
MASIARQSLRPAVAAARMATVPRVAAFTTTSRRSLLPPGPRKLSRGMSQPGPPAGLRQAADGH